MNLLIIEDDEAIKDGLKYCLEHEGYNVDVASNGETALKKLDNINLILLDVNLPDYNGFELFKKIKETHDIPIIFLTANDYETSIVMALDMGADDYITKPFRTKELIARIKKVLRTNNDLIHIKNITIDLNKAKVYKDGVDVMLTSIEYKILLTLALNPNKVFTREKILSDIWDVNEEYVYDNTLTVYIKRIREKIDSKDNSIIETVRGIGYRISN